MEAADQRGLTNVRFVAISPVLIEIKDRDAKLLECHILQRVLIDEPKEEREHVAQPRVEGHVREGWSVSGQVQQIVEGLLDVIVVKNRPHVHLQHVAEVSVDVRV